MACCGEEPTSAENHRMEINCEALHRKADALRRRMSRYLNDNREQFPEYNPDANPLNRCILYGNIVQTI
jgi:transposase